MHWTCISGAWEAEENSGGIRDMENITGPKRADALPLTADMLSQFSDFGSQPVKYLGNFAKPVLNGIQSRYQQGAINRYPATGPLRDGTPENFLKAFRLPPESY